MLPIYKPYKVKESVSVLEALNTGWVSSQGTFIQKTQDRIRDLLIQMTGQLSQSKKNLYVILTNNGTSSTHCLSMALKFKYPNVKKIYVPNNVYVAAINAMLFEFHSSFLEILPIDYDTLNLNCSVLPSLDKGSAVLVVHNMGNIVDVPFLKQQRPDLIFIEDACEAFYGKYPNSNVFIGASEDSLGTSFSFYANKTITSGEGGCFVTSDFEVYTHVHKRCHQGQTEKRYVHDVLAYNYRMTNLQAALLYDQLDLLPEILFLKENVFNEYQKCLEVNTNGVGILTNGVNPKIGSLTRFNARWLFYARIPHTPSYEIIDEFFRNKNIEIRPMFYPLHTHDHLSGIQLFDKSNSVVSDKVHRDYFIFPSFPTLSNQEIKYVSDCILECTRTYSEYSYDEYSFELQSEAQYSPLARSSKKYSSSFFVEKERGDALIKEIEEFISSLSTEVTTFRFFKSRSVSVIKNNVKTILVRDYNKRIISYGHLDKDDRATWVGLVVHKDYQNEKIGRKLLQSLLLNRESSEKIQLTVDKNNKPALCLYKNNGFEIVETHYDKYVMRLRKEAIISNQSNP